MSFKNPYTGNMSAPPSSVSNSGTSSLSPAFFAIAIAGSVAFLFLVTTVVIILRRFGYCFCPEPLPNPDDDLEHVPVPVARPLGLPVGLINSFPVCTYGSAECERLMAKGRGEKKRGQGGAEEKGLLGREEAVGGAGNVDGDSLKRNEGGGVEDMRELVIVAVSSDIADAGNADGLHMDGKCGDEGARQKGAVAAVDSTSSGRAPATAGRIEGDCGATAAEFEGFTGGVVGITGEGAGTGVKEVECTAETDEVRAAAGATGAGRQTPDGGDATNETSAAADATLTVDQGKECSVCLSEFEAGEPVKILPPCGHGFHVQCISEWLAAKDTCPLCRRCLAPRQRQVVIVRRRREDPFFWP